MQQTNGVAVLATHLAHTDRRALSQAWYSALHLADHAPPPSPRASTAAKDARGERSGGNVRDVHAQRRTAAHIPSAIARGAMHAPSAIAQRDASATVCASRRDAGSDGAERRVSTDLARRIERGLALCGPRSGAASFTVNAAEGRVHLVVRSDGARTRVVAVCAPPLRERVERALAHVRFAFAGSGLLAEVA